ncbi:MAG: hypothetical protein S4CHLAM37_14380 [Chlamydiia bacterium]|nr:hypothetical protein [Chlamydiia bacterium]
MAEVTLDSSSMQEAMPMDQGPGNFIIKTYDVCKKMEEKTEKFVKGANEDEKDVQARWKAANEARRLKELKISNMHMNAAYVSMTLMAANVACSLAGVTMNLRAETGGLAPVVQNYVKSGGEVLTSLGRAVGDHGARLAESFQQSKIQTMNSLISKDTEKGQTLWEVTKRDKESRKEDIKQIQQKTKQGTEDAIQKSAMTYNVGR